MSDHQGQFISDDLAIISIFIKSLKIQIPLQILLPRFRIHHYSHVQKFQEIFSMRYLMICDVFIAAGYIVRYLYVMCQVFITGFNSCSEIPGGRVQNIFCDVFIDVSVLSGRERRAVNIFYF